MLSAKRRCADGTSAFGERTASARSGVPKRGGDAVVDAEGTKPDRMAASCVSAPSTARREAAA